MNTPTPKTTMRAHANGCFGEIIDGIRKMASPTTKIGEMRATSFATHSRSVRHPWISQPTRDHHLRRWNAGQVALPEKRPAMRTPGGPTRHHLNVLNCREACDL